MGDVSGSKERSVCVFDQIEATLFLLQKVYYHSFWLSFNVPKWAPNSFSPKTVHNGDLCGASDDIVFIHVTELVYSCKVAKIYAIILKHDELDGGCITDGLLARAEGALWSSSQAWPLEAEVPRKWQSVREPIKLEHLPSLRP